MQLQTTKNFFLKTMEGPLFIIMIVEKKIAPSLPALHLVEVMNSVQNFEKKMKT